MFANVSPGALAARFATLAERLGGITPADRDESDSMKRFRVWMLEQFAGA